MKRATVIWPLSILSLCIIGLSFFAKESQGLLTLIGMGVIIGLVILDFYTPKIAGLTESNPKVKTMRRLNRLFIGFFTFIFMFLIWYPEAESIIQENESGLAFILTLVIIAIVGNTAPKLPFNRYMGLRLPWTVRDEETWKVAHKWLGYITFPIIILMIGAYLMGIEVGEVAKYGILTWIIIPGLYSAYVYHKRLG